MKKTLAVATTAALVGLSTLGLAASAGASTDVGEATFYTTADFGAETGAGYPSNDWFHGQLGGAWTQASITSSATGLNIAAAGAGAASQILNNQSFLVTDAAGFIADVDDIEVYASAGDWVLQIPVFGEPDSEFTTLRPASAGTTDSAGQWITSGVITDGLGTPLYAAGASDTLGNLVAALAQGSAPEVLAYGLWVSSANVSVYAVEAFDEVSVFTPIPVRTITPNPVTPEQTTTTGLVFTGSGWFPGAEIYISVFECEDGGENFDNSYDGSGVAAADGTFSVTVIFDEQIPVGTYCYYLDDDGVLYGAEVMPQLDNLVVSAAVIEETPGAAPALAATGAEDSTPWLLAAVAAVLLGAVAFVLSTRARRRTND